jgi:hypothetical protein
MGLCVRISTKKRPTADVVVLDGTHAVPTVVDVFELTTNVDPVPKQLADLHNNLKSRIVGLRPSRVVVRRADYSGRPTSQEGPKLRLLAEGALVAAACAECDEVILATGKEPTRPSAADGPDTGTQLNLDRPTPKRRQ